MSADERDAWVQDLFERIFETVSMLNVDLYRESGALTLTGDRLRRVAIRGDEVPEPSNAMGGRDVLRDADVSIPAPSTDIPLPLSQRAQARHRQLLDLGELREWIAENPGRIVQLVRGPFEVQEGETADASTMRMPPFMRNSNALPLTLSAWQYDLLMSWVKSVPSAARLKRAKQVPASPRLPAAISDAAPARRRAVLNRVRRTGGDGS